jgi:hypothetical protein
MRRYLVVARQTLDSPALADVVRDRLSEGPCVFHLLVPATAGHGLVWDEGQAHVAAEAALEEARLRFVAEGIPVTGEVGQANPVYAVEKVLRRNGDATYAEIILSTLPSTVSKWLRSDAPTRIRRMTSVPVTHLEAVTTPH